MVLEEGLKRAPIDRGAYRRLMRKKPKDPPGAPKLETWVDRLIAARQSGDDREAIRIAAAHVKSGEDSLAIGRAWEAYARPNFMRELGHDPEALIRDGLAILQRRWPVS